MYWSEIKELAVIFTVVGGAVMTLLVLTFSVALAVDIYSCKAYERATGKQTNYEFPAGCFVQTDDGWQLWEEYKLRAIASDGLHKVSEK